MTDYRSIVGKAVKTLETNPDNSQAEGQIWFNEFTGEFKNVINLEAFSTSASTNTSRYALGSASNGTQSAGLIFGGDESPPYSSASEAWNGSGWTNTPSLSQARTNPGGAGTQTAALGFAGYYTPPSTFTTATEEFNGSSWTSGGAMGTGRYRLPGAGLQTAALAIGGKNASTYYANTEE